MNGRAQGLKENYRKRNINNSTPVKRDLRNEMSRILYLIKKLNFKRYYSEYEFEKENISKKIDALELRLEDISRTLLRQKDSNLTNALINKKKNEIKEIEFLIKKNKLPKSEILTLLSKKMDLNIFLTKNCYLNSQNNQKKNSNINDYNDYQVQQPNYQQPLIETQPEYYPPQEDYSNGYDQQNGYEQQQYNQDYYPEDGYYDSQQPQYENYDYQQQDYQPQYNEQQSYYPDAQGLDESYEYLMDDQYNQFPVYYDPQHQSYSDLDYYQHADDPLYYPLQDYGWSNDLDNQQSYKSAANYPQKKNESKTILKNKQKKNNKKKSNFSSLNSYPYENMSTNSVDDESENDLDDYYDEPIKIPVEVVKDSNSMESGLSDENVNNTIKIPVEIVKTEKEIVKVPVEVVKDSYDMYPEINNSYDTIQQQSQQLELVPKIQETNINQQQPINNEKEIVKIPVEIVKDGYDIYPEFNNFYDAIHPVETDITQPQDYNEQLLIQPEIKEAVKKIPIEIVKEGYEPHSDFENFYQPFAPHKSQAQVDLNEPEILTQPTNSIHENVNIEQQFEPEILTQPVAQSIQENIDINQSEPEILTQPVASPIEENIDIDEQYEPEILTQPLTQPVQKQIKIPEIVNEQPQMPQPMFYDVTKSDESQQSINQKLINQKINEPKKQKHDSKHVVPVPPVHIPNVATKGIAKFQPYINVTDYESLLTKQSEICEEFDDLLEKEFENKLISITEDYIYDDEINQSQDYENDVNDFDNNIDQNFDSQFVQTFDAPVFDDTQDYSEFEQPNNYQEYYPQYDENIINQPVTEQFVNEPIYQDVNEFVPNENYYYQDQNTYQYPNEPTFEYDSYANQQPIEKEHLEESKAEVKPESVKAVPLVDDDDWFADDDEFDDLFE